MEWQQKETIILNLIATTFKLLLQEHPNLPIRAESRAGAEISNFLEERFVRLAKNQPGVLEVAGSPKGKTKNPYDIKLTYEFSANERELVWIDIKATNASYQDSNPDMGTYKKFLNFFRDGNYFAVYCQFAYLPEGNSLNFVKNHKVKWFVFFY